MFSNTTHFSMSDLDLNGWIYPCHIISDEEKLAFSISLPPSQHLISDYFNQLKREVIRKKEIVDNLSQLAYERMMSSCNFWLEKEAITSEIEKAWLCISHYIRLIQAEFDILYAYRPTYFLSVPFPLQNEEIIILWNQAYNKWKIEIESYIQLLNSNYNSPDFSVIVKNKSDKHQKALNKFLYTTSRKKASNCSDGEAEFWRAVDNGSLDSIGF